MSRYEVQHKSSGIVAFSSSERLFCQHWYECNNYGPDIPVTDPDTGEIYWKQGEYMDLYVIVRKGTQ